MAFDPKDTRNLVIALGLGAAAGAAVIQSHHDEKATAEKDGRERTEWICEIVWDLLDDWEPPDMECEELHRAPLPVLDARNRNGLGRRRRRRLRE